MRVQAHQLYPSLVNPPRKWQTLWAETFSECLQSNRQAGQLGQRKSTLRRALCRDNKRGEAFTKLVEKILRQFG